MGMLPSPSGWKADYGIDAPRVVRAFVLGGGCVVMVSLVLWRVAESLPVSWRNLMPLCFGAGMALLVTGLVMIWGSRVGKLSIRDKVIERLHLQGNEQVLDIGCGRGLMLLGMAKRLKTGRAVGIDLWQVEDQSGNAITTTEDNARHEGVAEQVELHTGDMCQLPFEDGRFDVVVSSWAIHNITTAELRKRAVEEAVRVTKPGGKIVLIDISYTGEYLHTLKEMGCQGIERLGPTFVFVLPSYQLWARKHGEQS